MIIATSLLRNREICIRCTIDDTLPAPPLNIPITKTTFHSDKRCTCIHFTIPLSRMQIGRLRQTRWQRYSRVKTRL